MHTSQTPYPSSPPTCQHLPSTTGGSLSSLDGDPLLLLLDSVSPAGSESSEDSSDDAVYCTPRKRWKVGSGSARGQKAWYRQKERTALAKSGQLPPDSGKAQRFVEKVRTINANAEISPNYLKVRCSVCTTWATLRAPYEIRRFKEHRKTTTCEAARKQHGFCPSLAVFGFTKKTSVIPKSSSSTPLMISVPCPGLARTNYPKLDQYLAHSASAGGGARSRLTLARLLWEKAWSDLSPKESMVVLRRVAQEHKWMNQHGMGSVYSVTCLKDVKQTREAAALGNPKPCSSCLALLRLRPFQTAINRLPPPESRMKHV